MRTALAFVFVLGATTLWASVDEHDHGQEPATSLQGATFKEGQGVTVSAQTSAAIGLTSVDVEEKALTPDARLTGQVYRLAHEASQNLGERAGYAYASAMVTPASARQWTQNAPILVSLDAGIVTGQVTQVDDSMIEAGGLQVDVLLEIPDPDKTLRIGSFVEARLAGAAGVPTTVVPRSAILQTALGIFVFVRNGEAYLRTPVTLGVHGEQTVEVVDGLYAGDSIAASAVETLYLIELRATKGGGHSH